MFKFNGGENGIRTHDRIYPIHAFQACALNHSAISPKKLIFPVINNLHIENRIINMSN